MSRPSIAIIGGGFTGAAVAFHLARAGVPADIVVFELRARLGGGLAYGGDDPIHRVNVPATRMSLIPEEPDHFARWLEASGVLASDAQAFAGGEAYPRRREFGRYVAQSLAPHLACGAVRHAREAVVSVEKQVEGWRVGGAGGETLRADVVVLAATHCGSTPPPQVAAFRGDPRIVFDPLADRVVADIGAHERVLIVGAGLTAADLVAALDAQGHRAAVTLVSRRGLRARGRNLGACPPEGDFLHPPARTATELLHRVRAAIRTADAIGLTWQNVIEAVRNQGQDIWLALDVEARRRIVRHLRAFWDVHRFRAAPQIEAILDGKLKDGSLRLRRARLGVVTPTQEAIAVELRDIRAGAASVENFERVILAIGPTHRDTLTSQPFLKGLAEAGRLALDPTGLGLQTARDARAIGADGVAEPSLFVAGPLARGTFGELMGLPQVSFYAQFVADEAAKAARSCSLSRQVYNIGSA